MCTEIWKSIPGFEELYEASNLGNIRSLPRIRFQAGAKLKGRVMKSSADEWGYRHLSLRVNGVRKTYKVHRLVLMAFVGVSDLQVNHRDGVKFNNKLENLEYVTPSENLLHAMELGLHNIQGEAGKTSVLKNVDTLKIKELIKSGEMTFKEIATIYGVHRGHISSINIGRAWRWLGDYDYPIRKAA